MIKSLSGEIMFIIYQKKLNKNKYHKFEMPQNAVNINILIYLRVKTYFLFKCYFSRNIFIFLNVKIINFSDFFMV